MRYDHDFVDDGASFRVRREAELAAEERRAYIVRHFNLKTLRLIRRMMVPVWIAAVIFALTVLYVIGAALFT
jgi:hypothetical protein